MAFAAGTKVKINVATAGEYNGTEGTVVGLDALDPEVYDIEGIKTDPEFAGRNIVKVAPQGDFQSLLASIQEGNEDGSIHLVFADDELVTA